VGPNSADGGDAVTPQIRRGVEWVDADQSGFGVLGLGRGLKVIWLRARVGTGKGHQRSVIDERS